MGHRAPKASGGEEQPKGIRAGCRCTPGCLAIDPAVSWLPLSRTLAPVGHTKQDGGMPVSSEPWAGALGACGW